MIMWKKINNSWFVYFIIIIMMIYEAYLVSLIYKTGSFAYFIFFCFILAALTGLILNKEWSKYFVLFLALLISLWEFGLILDTVFSKGFDYANIGGKFKKILSLVPEVLLIIFCTWCTIAVFRYLKLLKKDV